MTIHPHLPFKGDCKQAFEFYANVLGGKIVFIMTYGESPMAAQTPSEMRDKVLHAAVQVDGAMFTGADAPPNQFEKATGVSVLLSIEDAAQADRVFNAMSEGGQVQMPIQETFWAQRFGMLIDRFGIPWMINCSKAM